MNQQDQDMFLTHAKTRSFLFKMRATQNYLRKMKKEGEIWSISFSGGKDSLVLFHLARQCIFPFYVWHFDWGRNLMPQCYEDQLKNTLQLYNIPIAYQIYDLNTLTDPTDESYFYQSIKNHITNHKINVCCIGLRKEESCRRKFRLQHGLERSYGALNIFPLKNWTWKDIWAYICLYQIPYPKSYDERADIMGWSKLRFVTFFDESYISLGQNDQDNFFNWESKYL
jgi:3'-phosphoadenosine 5'-phosphosulfate sulfotransferase (PAPS reductase)/FAD synthetase